MNKICSLLLVVLLVSCGSSRVITSKEEQRKYGENKPEVSNAPKTNTHGQEKNQDSNLPAIGVNPNSSNKVVNYISQYSAIAQYEMKQFGIPASITLAQGILESGAGEGDLTKRANNHFGIKCHGWNGEKVYHDDDKKQECFRKYHDPRESFKDHSLFLTSRGRYASLFKLKKTDYKGWAKGLRKAGYATDSKYPAKLISLIERYDLHKYDKDITVVEDSIEDLTSAVDESIYIVKKGDTLYSISRSNNTTVEVLKRVNGLNSTELSVGQEIKLK
ncbi:glucosaminidase domain-containing protein [Pseudofulvibacter geojedonensis]|uniref:Peptidoglycan hydrolase n=1 Tax=Pseudofulvibacter geojedonensis TaxID=1123758 RepID=A0ABW3I4M3_9FLAO